MTNAELDLAVIDRDSKLPRVETGAIQFGDDWPGIFIRGDHAAYYAMCLNTIMDEHSEASSDAIARLHVGGLIELLESSRIASHKEKE